jgi:excinuclease UvrABC nuclease subunit
MMEEMIGRMITHLDGGMPNLLVIDGGKGHLEVVGQLVDEHQVTFEDGGLHRTGGHPVPIRHRRFEREHDPGDEQAGPEPLLPE